MIKPGKTTYPHLRLVINKMHNFLLQAQHKNKGGKLSHKPNYKQLIFVKRGAMIKFGREVVLLM